MRYFTASSLLTMSRTSMTTAAVQNTRPLLPELPFMWLRLRELPRSPRHRRGGGHWNDFPFRVLPPQHPGQEERAETDRHVRNVAGRPARISKADVDEVHDTER